MIIWVVQKPILTNLGHKFGIQAYPGLSADARSWAWSKGQELYETVYNAYCNI